MNQIKVLIVDDSAVYRNFFENILKYSGFQVRSIDSAEAGIEILKIYQPNIIILDIVLKKMSGWQMCRQLKKDSKWKLIPILICSSRSTQVDRIWAKMAGADRYLTKPIAPKELIKMIEELTLFK